MIFHQENIFGELTISYYISMSYRVFQLCGGAVGNRTPVQKGTTFERLHA